MCNGHLFIRIFWELEESMKRIVACNVYFVPSRDASRNTLLEKKKKKKRREEKGKLKIYKYPC